MAIENTPSIANVALSVMALRDLLDERDRSYIERFNAAERNVATAMTASEKAVTTAMAAAEKAVATAMSAAEKAVSKAEVAAEKRFDAVNEFRQQLADQQITFARSDLMNSRFSNLEKRLEDLGTSMVTFHSTYRGRASVTSDIWGWIFGVAMAAIAAMSLWVNSRGP